MSTLSKLAQYNNNRGVAPTSVGVASKKESTSTLGKLQNYAQQAAEEQARAAQAAAEGEKNNGGFFGGLGYLGEKIGLGFLSGIEGIWDYTAGGLAKLFGADDWAERQFANDWVNYSHADEWYNPSDGWKVAGDVAGGIGTSLPAIAGVAAAAAIAYFSGGSLSGVSAGIISGVVAGLGAAGNATKEAYRETGELGGKEFGYGALSGITEGAVEGLSAGIGAGTGAIVKNISKSFGKEVAKTTAKAAARETFGKAIIKGFVGEAFEEGLSEFLDPYWKRLTYDPEAKNATAQEIGYAALIGGLSGAIMGGFDATVRNTSNTIRGNNIVNKGTATDVITTAENIANSDIYTDQYESFGAVKNILNELQTSMQKTDGEIRTVKQKMLLGYLERANTYTVFEPMVQKNAARIVANADAIAERLNTYGYTDAQGKPITYTAEQIRAGIDTNNPKSYAKALKTNNILRTLAVVDATGQLYMDTKKFEAATLRGETLSSQVDLNRFIETASQEELHSVAEKLDIADWQGLTNEQFKEKIVAFAERGGIEEYQIEQHTNADIKAAADAVDVQKAKAKIPQKFTAKKDGVTRYTQGGVDMAVIKNGDSYRIYDYESGKLSKPLTLQQVNERLTEIRGKVDSVVNTAAVESITTEESRQAAEIDAYAAENISAYSKLSDANKSLVRGVIRQARAAGISEADSLSYARVAAHAGINISFDKQAKVGDIEILKVGTDESGNAIYADGVYFPETNSIYVNPEAKRSQERLLIHELTHAIFTTSDGKVFLMDGVEKMSAAEKETIIKRYVEAGHGGTVEIIDEINAHFAEGQLQNKKLLKRLTEEKPSFKQKILSFFKKTSSEYNSDERLSGAAKKLYKQYKKMFDSFAAENQHNNAFEPVKISEAADSSRMALSDALKTLGEYSETRKRHIESREYDTISRDYNEISEFIKSANKLTPVKRLHIGTISDTTADLVFKKTGVDIKNYDFVLASNYIAHIFDGHGDVNVETPRGQKAVTFANIENVLETVITPDDVSLVSDNNGTALRFEKRLDGRNIAITVTSTKKSTLTLKSAWIINESGGRTPSANAVTLAGTSETSGRNSTTHSISENTEKVNTKQAKTPKNVKYALPEIDSRGKKLTEQQRQFFSDSKVVDSKGNLQVVYHGTNNEFYTFNKELVGKGIDQFGAGYYFTTDKGGAENYGSRVLDVYLNIKKPFTITMTDSGGGLDQFYSRSLTKTQAYKILKMHPELYSTDNSPLGDWSERFWTEGATESVIREVAAQMTQIGSFADNSMFGYYPNEFHAAIKEVLGYDGVKVDLRNGESFYVAWEQNQIKDTANARPTTSPDIRYALQLGDEQITVDSEQGKNLVALHNLSEQNLLKVLQLGGFPMPSIAVTKVDLPHENYGNISIVFGRNTIDPEVDSRNVVYDRDAWTPTAPSTDVKLKTEAVDSLISELQGEVGEYSGYRYDVDRFFDGRYKNGAGEYVIEDYNYNKKTVGELATHNAGIMAAYLKEKGADISPIYAERGFTMGWQSFTRSEAQALLQAVGITENITRDNITAEQRAEILEKYINYKAEKNYRLLKRRKPETTFESCYERAKSNYDDGDVSQLLFLSEDFYNKNRPKDVLDDAATEKKLRDSISDMEDFYSWLWNKIENTFEKKGVYNDSDAFDRYGNRRSFEQRHYAYTVGNIVKAMSKGSQEGNAFLGGMTSGALAAKLSVQFDSIESIRAAQDYLKLVSNEEIEAFNSKTYEMYDEIVTEIAGASSDFMSNQTRRDDVGNILGECATVTPLNIENIKRKFAKETKGYDVGYKFNDSIANKVFALFQVLQHIPTTYFEAKPRRAVGLSEIVSVVLPKNSSTELVSKLKSKHIPYEFYDASNGTTRQDVIRKIDSARFALPDTDSTGKKLSTQQREFFSNSKVVDGDGRLLMVYHGTPNGDFYTFEYDKSRQTGTDYGKAFYFTTNLKNAKGYAKDNHRDPRVKEYELKRESLKKQILAETDTTKRQELEKQFRNVKVDGKSILEILYDVDYDTGGEVRQVYLNLVNPLIADAQKKYHYEVYPELFKQAIKNGNDGIIVRNVDDSSKYGVDLSDVYIAFSPEQIKLTTNETPTVNNDIRYALPDEKTLEFLNSQKTIKVYRAMQVIDGELYPPMAAKIKTIDGKNQLVNASKLGQWEESVERPDLITNGNKFKLDKANGSSITAAYNPYFHTSLSPLNDQFSSAYKRDNLVIVEGEIPQSELTSGYKAQYAKDSVGETQWHSGVVSSKLKGEKARKVILSRWFKPVRIVPNAEVAGVIAKILDGENISVPANVVTPSLRVELEKAGVKIDNNIRFALDDSDRDVRGNYTAGQRAKFAANNTAMKVYSRSDAESVISAIMDERLTFDDGKYGVLAGKNRAEVVDYLFKKLNTVKEGYRIGVALKIADYLIDNTTLSDMYAAETVSESMRTLSVLRYYMHKMDLSGIQSEIKHRYDNKNTINLLWAAPKGEKGIAPDTLAQSLESDAIFLSGWNEADMFFEVVDMYESARRDVQESVQQQSLKDYGGKEQLEKLRQDIARDILLAYDNKGTKSKYAKLVEKYTTQIQSLKQQVREANSYNRLVNSVVDKAQRMRDLKLGTFLNSTQYKNDVFKSSIEGLARIKNRGNFNIAGTRKILADLRTWYTTDNPILADTYEQGVADMLDSFSAGNKRFTKEELVTLNNVMAYFTKYVENFNKVYKNGKWVEAIPEATRYIDTIHANSELKVGLFRKLAGTTYMQTFGDPMTVARRMDMYEPNGFYTETLQQLRDAAVDSKIAEMEIMSSYDAFMKKNKKYLAQITKETVSYGGKNVPRSVLIGLYMTLKRQHAQAGLAQNGFAYVDTDGKRVRIDGFAPNIETDAELYFRAVEEQKKIESLLTAADKEYIAILEQAYNNDAKKLKADRDMQRLGFTNATEDYYYPIRRGNIAKNVDTSDIQGEIDRVSNSSFNKDTVKGAKQELFIESADTVFKRHIHAVCQYAFLSPAIETYNRIFNLDVSGNPNKPVSVATESANTWAKGNKYFSKLISDIQGIPTSSGEGNKVLGFIRGNYAKFQLGANPKVWVTQLSSLFASSSILDADSITKGMFISAKDVDTYCSLAKLRNKDNTAALAQGVLDKLGKVSDVLMAPIGKMDRFVVCRLFGACQVQVAKNGGAKIGTEANKIAAGQLLRRVILETQQNSVATERSAAMRSGNEILRTVTMFTADSMKVVGRVIDSIGELSTLKAKLKVTSNADVRATLQKSIKLANRKVRKSVTSLVTSALFMAAIAQLFSWLYNKDKKDDESTAQTVLIDFLGNLIGGLPVIKDIYARIAQGYDFSNYAYSSINDLLDSSINLVEAAKNLVSGDASQQDIAKGVKNLSYSLGQMFGVPTRNIYNIAYGLTKRVSPVSAYKIDNRFYKKNYVSDLNKALENDDAEMVSYIMSLIYNQRIGDMVNEETRQKLSDLYAKGYSILPRSIGDSIRYDGNEIEMNDAQKRRFMSIYSQASRYIEKLLASSGYGNLSEEKQAKAIKSIYDAFYYQAISDLVGQDANNTLGELSRYIAIEKLAVVFSGLSEIASDVDSKGNTISGSRKRNTVAYLLKQNLSDGERLLIMCYRGYSIQGGDYKGYSEQRARIILLKYILSLKATQAEKAKIAAECGFSVKNGKIDRSSLYSGVGSLSKKNK